MSQNAIQIKKKYNMNLVKYKDIQTIIFHLDEIIYKYQHS